MTLNRNSYYTAPDGTTTRVKHMSYGDLLNALYFVQDLILEEECADPYLIETICRDSQDCPAFFEPVHRLNGHNLQDWLDQINKEIDARYHHPFKIRFLLGYLASKLGFL